MASYVPPSKNSASGWIGYVQLIPRVPTGQFQANPTLASGDVKISIDGGALANLGTLPAVTPASSTWVKITLSQAETNGDNIAVQFIDAAGAEWCDTGFALQTAAQTIDGLNTLIDALPTNAELATALGTADDATLAAIAALNNLSQANIRTAVGLSTANLDTQLDALPTNAELATALGTADDAVLAAVAALNNLSQANIRTAVGLASANLDTQLDALPTNTELATALGTADDAVLAAIATVQSDTDNIQTRLPAALVSGRMDSSVGAMAADTLTASAVATDAVTEIQAGLSTLTAAGIRTAVGLASANLDTQLDALPTNTELSTALGTADDAILVQVALVKAKTDSLTFTVAGKVDSNIHYVNGTQVDGNGSDGNQWGPV